MLVLQSRHFPYRHWSLECEVWGLGFGVQHLGRRVEGIGSRAQGLGFGVWELTLLLLVLQSRYFPYRLWGVRVWRLGFRVWNSGFLACGLGFRVWGCSFFFFTLEPRDE